MIPTVADWLSLPKEMLSEQVRQTPLTIMLSLDGTRRHYLLSKGYFHNEIDDFEEFTRHNAQAYVGVYDLLYSLGVCNIMTSILYPPNFKRNSDYLENALQASQKLLLNEPFLELYSRWQVKVRLYGDFDIAPISASARTTLLTMDRELMNLTPDGETGLLCGFCAGSFADEQIARTLQLNTALSRPPTEAELRIASYPYADKIDIYIGAGWLRVGQTLPPLLGSNTNLYFLSYLASDLTEDHLRRILYDHLFLRFAASEDDVHYSSENLRDLADFYAAHQSVTGLGRVIGPGLWYVDQREEYR